MNVGLLSKMPQQDPNSVREIICCPPIFSSTTSWCNSTSFCWQEPPLP